VNAPDRTAEHTHFSEHAEWTGVTNDDRAAWLDIRRTMVTASDVAAIMGEDQFRSPWDVYVAKRVEQPEAELDLEDPRVLGAVVEQPILQYVAKRRGWNYRKGGALLRSRAYPFLGATLDAEIDRGDGAWCDLEGKTTELAGDWDEESGQLPTRVLIQAQTQLLVTGAPVAIVFAWLRRWKTATIEVYPSPELHAIIREYAERFLELVRSETPPPVDGRKSTTRAIAQLFAAEDGTAVQLPREAAAWTHEIKELAAQRKELEAREEELKNLLRLHIGNATIGVLDGVEDIACWRWQLQKRAEHVVQASESRVLRSLKNLPFSPRSALPPATPVATVHALPEASGAAAAPKTRRRRSAR
jgi:putative phage-type endonuclease